MYFAPSPVRYLEAQWRQAYVLFEHNFFLPNPFERQCGRRHQLTYKIAAISASLGVTSLAILAVHYRFAWHMQNGGDVPYLEAAATILLTFGGVVSIECKGSPKSESVKVLLNHVPEIAYVLPSFETRVLPQQCKDQNK